jgi:phospholipase C
MNLVPHSPSPRTVARRDLMPGIARTGSAGRTRAGRVARWIGVLAVAGLAVAPTVRAADPSSSVSPAGPSASVSPAGPSVAPSAGSSALPSATSSPTSSAAIAAPKAATPIEHVVVLMQENHTFDNYFGTYPGADGIPAGLCMPRDPADASKGCVEAYHLPSRRTVDLNHGQDVALAALNGGKLDGFIAAQNKRNLPGDVAMGYYDGSDLPFYWNLATTSVLADRFFSSDHGGSKENHMYWVAGQSGGGTVPRDGYTFETIFDRLQAAGISWKFYVQNYDPSITYRNLTGDAQDSQIIWVPLLNFGRYLDDPALSSRIVDVSQYHEDLAAGTLPAVAFMVPSGASEHPPGDVAIGQVYGASQITALMQSSSWSSSLFVLTWDDWGGWYDHVDPPQIDSNGYGMRVPALFVSPYAPPGRIDSTTYDFTSILRFIEDNWGIEPMTARDAAANSVGTALDFTAGPWPAALPGPVYPDDRSINPRARLALLGIYGVVVLGIPATAAVWWRRRRLVPERPQRVPIPPVVVAPAGSNARLASDGALAGAAAAAGGLAGMMAHPATPPVTVPKVVTARAPRRAAAPASTLAPAGAKAAAAGAKAAAKPAAAKPARKARVRPEAAPAAPARTPRRTRTAPAAPAAIAAAETPATPKAPARKAPRRAAPPNVPAPVAAGTAAPAKAPLGAGGKAPRRAAPPKSPVKAPVVATPAASAPVAPVAAAAAKPSPSKAPRKTAPAATKPAPAPTPRAAARKASMPPVASSTEPTPAGSPAPTAPARAAGGPKRRATLEPTAAMTPPKAAVAAKKTPPAPTKAQRKPAPAAPLKASASAASARPSSNKASTAKVPAAPPTTLSPARPATTPASTAKVPAGPTSPVPGRATRPKPATSGPGGVAPKRPRARETDKNADDGTMKRPRRDSEEKG